MSVAESDRLREYVGALQEQVAHLKISADQGLCWLIRLNTPGDLRGAEWSGVHDRRAVAVLCLHCSRRGRRIGLSCRCSRSRGRRCRPLPPGRGRRSVRAALRCGSVMSWASGTGIRISRRGMGCGGRRGCRRRSWRWSRCCSSLRTTQSQRDRLQYFFQAAGPPAVAGGQARHLLSERRLGARGVAADEPPGLQADQHLLAAARGISQLTLVAAVHPPRHHAASRIGRLGGTGPGQHMHRPARCGNALDGQAGQVRGQDGDTLKIARQA